MPGKPDASNGTSVTVAYDRNIHTRVQGLHGIVACPDDKDGAIKFAKERRTIEGRIAYEARHATTGLSV